MILLLFISIVSSPVFIYGDNAATFVTLPVSLNTSLNSTVNFTCEATGDVSAIIFYVYGIAALEQGITKQGFTELDQETINGTIRRSLSAHAQENNNNTNIYCLAVTSSVNLRSDNATLTIQGLLACVGDLNYTFINGSSVLLTWTAPYTLDNVPITGYYIIVNGLVNITTTNNNTNITLSTTNPNPCMLNKVSVSPVNDVGIGSSNIISFYYETVPLITPIVSIVPVVDGQQILMHISIDVSELCIGEYPNSAIVIILNVNNEIQDSDSSISTKVNDQLMITGIVLITNELNTFIVNVSLSNNGGDFLPIPSFGFGFNIASSIDNCSTIDITWTAPTVDDRVSILYYNLSIYDDITGSLVDTVSVYDTSYQFVDNNLFIHRYTYIITEVNELGEGISNNDTFSYQRVPRSVTRSVLSKTFNETIASISFNIPVLLECTGEAPENATVTIQCNGTGVVYSNTVLVENVRRPMNITGSILVPQHQQCSISIVFSNEAGTSEPFILPFNTIPPIDLTPSPTTGTIGAAVISFILATICGVIVVICTVILIVLRKLYNKYKRQSPGPMEMADIFKKEDEIDGNCFESDIAQHDDEEEVNKVQKRFPVIAFRQVFKLYEIRELKDDNDGSWSLSDLDTIVAPGTGDRVLKVLNEAGAKSLDSRVYKELLSLIATCFVLRLLNLNFPDDYKIKFSPQFGLDFYKKEDPFITDKIVKSLELCDKLHKQNLSDVANLKPGYSLIDAIDEIIEMCA